MENIKVSIGILFAVLLQGGAFVWWTAQQASTLDQLTVTVSKLEEKILDGQLITIDRDIEDLRKDMEDLENDLKSMKQQHINDMRMVAETFKQQEDMIAYSATYDELTEVIRDMEELESKLEDLGAN